MFRVMRESENVDERQHCFLAQSPGKPPRYLSVETRQELLRVEAAWHTAVCSAVTHLKVSNKLLCISLEIIYRIFYYNIFSLIE